jgi:two-component system nitrogen regulation response regulator GlnG
MITNVTGIITRESLPKNFFKSGNKVDLDESLEEIMSRKLDYFVRNAIESNSNSLMSEVIPKVERPLLKILLQQTNWNQQKTARILGINRNTLRKKIETLGLKNQ